MRRIHWAAEVQDAHLVEGLLRANGIQAWSFDSGIVRLNWMNMLAYGGCRVMVGDADVEQALQIVSAYRTGGLALQDDEADMPRCPACVTCAAHDDPAPRRGVFAFLLAYSWFLPVVLLIANRYGASRWIEWTSGVLAVALVIPGVVGRLIKSRLLCSHCGHAWRAPPRSSFGEMARAVDTAERNAVATLMDRKSP